MRHLVILCVVLMSAMGAAAQKGLSINGLFDGRYRDNKDATETIIKGEVLREYLLDTYHALTLTSMPEAAQEIEKLVTKDGTEALSREVSYRQGHLYFGFYRLKNLKDRKRYIFYLNQNLNKGNKIILIYLDGDADTETVKKMLK